MGPFFRRFARELTSVGATVSKINFNGGDQLFFGGVGAVPYRGTLHAWPNWLKQFCLERRIDVIFLFGDCRAYHSHAMRIAKKTGIPVYVFEEGYLRPDFITLERGGVNGHSTMGPRPEHSGEAPEAEEVGEGGEIGRAPDEVRVGKAFWLGARCAAAYSWALTLLAWRYPSYAHHRDLNPIREALRWIRGGIRKFTWRYRDRHALARLTATRSKRYFVVPLQVHNDFQLGHSRFTSVEAFLREVVASFAAHAPSDQVLVVKHHPMDRPYRDYTHLLGELRKEHRLGARLLYVADLHLPTLLRHARGTVVINSTVGLQSLRYGTPVLAEGQAVYNSPGLTAQCDLATFWRHPGKVDRSEVSRFISCLRRNNQANGSFIRPLTSPRLGPTGVRWFENSTIEVRASVLPAPAQVPDEATADALAQRLPPIHAGSEPIGAPGPAPAGGQ